MPNEMLAVLKQEIISDQVLQIKLESLELDIKKQGLDQIDEVFGFADMTDGRVEHFRDIIDNSFVCNLTVDSAIQGKGQLTYVTQKGKFLYGNIIFTKIVPDKTRFCGKRKSLTKEDMGALARHIARIIEKLNEIHHYKKENQQEA